MNNLNSILLEGNLVKDPTLNKTAKGTMVCQFTLASNRNFKNEGGPQKEVSYFDVETWARQAEVCAEYLAKGRGVRIMGRLKQDRWKDDSGHFHSRMKIVADNVEFKPSSRKSAEQPKQEAEAVNF